MGHFAKGVGCSASVESAVFRTNGRNVKEAHHIFVLRYELFDTISVEKMFNCLDGNR